MSVQRILCVLLSLLSISCGQPNFMYNVVSPDGKETKIAPVYLDEKWSVNERSLLHVAINEWNVALAGHLVLKVVDETYHVDRDHFDADPGYIFIKTDSSDPLINKQEQFLSYAWTHGRGDGVGGNRIYFVIDRFPGWNLLPIARHEIGHTLGAPHLDENHRGLMSDRFNPMLYNCIDKDAVFVVAKYRHLSVDGMTWCNEH